MQGLAADRELAQELAGTPYAHEVRINPALIPH
jgi:hypothetical protein